MALCACGRLGFASGIENPRRMEREDDVTQEKFRAFLKNLETKTPTGL